MSKCHTMHSCYILIIDVSSADPVFPSWPTPSGITELKAEELCRSAILKSQLSSLCNTSIVYDTRYLESCKIDVLVSYSLENIKLSFVY